MKTCGVSPKVIATAVTGLVVYLLTKLAIAVDPVVEQAINVGLMVLAGYLAPPGDVVVADESLEFDPAAGDVTPPPKR